MHLLQHHKRLGHLEQHGQSHTKATLPLHGEKVVTKGVFFPSLWPVPPSSMGDKIFSTLSAVSSARETKHVNQPNQHQSPQTVDQPASFVEDIAFEVIAVTDCAEVELGTSVDSEVAMGESSTEEGRDASTAEPEDCLLVLPNELISQGEVIIEASEEETQEKAAGGSSMMATPGDNRADLPSRPQKNPLGPHDCPDCQKKFKFASSLIAHRVIHTGERPHRCGDCGRCFSFRQSLDRHRQTHRSARGYNCAVCGETFHSLSARTEHEEAHEEAHAEGGVYACHQCPGTFSSETALAKHLKSHAADPSAKQPPEVDHEVVGEVGLVSTPSCQVLPDEVQADSDSPEAEGRAGSTPEVDDSLPSAVKVRTSGRKRRPTMKIQVINLQKRLAAKRQQMNKGSSPKLRPLPLNW